MSSPDAARDSFEPEHRLTTRQKAGRPSRFCQLEVFPPPPDRVIADLDAHRYFVPLSDEVLVPKERTDLVA